MLLARITACFFMASQSIVEISRCARRSYAAIVLCVFVLAVSINVLRNNIGRSFMPVFVWPRVLTVEPIDRWSGRVLFADSSGDPCLENKLVVMLQHSRLYIGIANSCVVSADFRPQLFASDQHTRNAKPVAAIVVPLGTVELLLTTIPAWSVVWAIRAAVRIFCRRCARCGYSRI